MAGNPENTAPQEMTIVDMLEVLALTLVALDQDAPRGHRIAARVKAAKFLGLDTARVLP